MQLNSTKIFVKGRYIFQCFFRVINKLKSFKCFLLKKLMKIKASIEGDYFIQLS